MKTGFSHGFALQPVGKTYIYHGMIMPCKKPPNPDPFLDEETGLGGPAWEIIYEVWPVKIGDYILYYNSVNFFASTEYKYCYLGFPDNMARYYFFEIEYHNGIPGHGAFILFANGKYCNWQVDSGFWDYHYRALFRYVWGRYNYLMVVQNPGVGTHIKIWRSTNGELPNYWPVPPV